MAYDRGIYMTGAGDGYDGRGDGPGTREVNITTHPLKKKGKNEEKNKYPWYWSYSYSPFVWVFSAWVYHVNFCCKILVIFCWESFLKFWQFMIFGKVKFFQFVMSIIARFKSEFLSLSNVTISYIWYVDVNQSELRTHNPDTVSLPFTKKIKKRKQPDTVLVFSSGIVKQSIKDMYATTPSSHLFWSPSFPLSYLYCLRANLPVHRWERYTKEVNAFVIFRSTPLSSSTDGKKQQPRQVFHASYFFYIISSQPGMQ